MRTADQDLAGQFQNSNGLFSRYRRESIEKRVKGFACFQVVYKILDGNTGPGKNRRTAKDFRVALDNLIGHWRPPKCSNSFYYRLTVKIITLQTIDVNGTIPGAGPDRPREKNVCCRGLPRCAMRQEYCNHPCYSGHDGRVYTRFKGSQELSTVPLLYPWEGTRFSPLPGNDPLCNKKLT